MNDTTMTVTTGELAGPGRPSEDRIFQTPGATIVLDGVSTVSEQTPRGGWYAQVLGEHLADALQARPGADLQGELEQAIATVAKEHELVPGRSPAATVAIVRHHGATVDALVLADSPVIARRTDATTDEVRDDRLARLIADREEHAHYRALLRQGAGFDNPKHRTLLQQLRDHQMRYLNNGVPGGYWVAEAVPDAARHAVVRSWPAADLAEILVMTDGVSCAVEEYGLYPTWGDLVRACRTDGPQRVIHAVHAAEAKDPDGRLHPRYKKHDDKALAYCTLPPAAALRSTGMGTIQVPQSK